jgi:DNA-binding CsgD family transcriptional regulator/tetratricopeptide (TPR) repeat protein
MDGPAQVQRAVALTDGRSRLLGRAGEVRQVDELVAGVRDGRSAALVLQGEPGIGKTSLLRYAVHAARGLHTLDVAGAESEQQLGYAGLHRLLLPHLDRLGVLPAPQRAALSAAFGLAGGPAPDRFLVGLGTLTLLADVAADRPLLCILDDAHWLDAESLETLAFVGRRLHVDGIGLLVALRHEGAAGMTALRGLPVHAVGGLSPEDSRSLLARAVPGRLDDRVADEIAAQTGGNPLAVLALAEELTAEQLAGRAQLPVPLPVDAHVERWFLTQVRAMPAATQLLLLVAALAPPEDPATLWDAAAQLGLTPEDADPAVKQRILLVGSGIAFRHPLMRSAVHAAATVGDRRRAHAALAAASPRNAVPEQRAWHLAAAAAGTDDEVAADLEESGERLRSRGGYAAWAAFLARSAELTSDPVRRAGRFVSAARAHLYAGNPGQAQVVLDRAAPGLGGAVVRARAEQARAAIYSYHYRMAEVPAMLLRALAEAGPVDEQLTRDLLWEAMRTALLARRSMAGTTLADVARAALDALDRLGPGPGDTDRLLRAFAVRIATGYRAARGLLGEAVAALADGEPVRPDAGGRVLFGVLAAEELWDDRGRRRLLERVTRFDRDHGDLNELCLAQRCAVAGELRAGRFADALACHDEALELTLAMGMPATGDADLAELWAWQGRAAEARAAAGTLASVWAGKVGMGVMTTVSRQTLCVLELGLGRYPQALEQARGVFEEDAAGYANRSLADLVEAAIRAGDRAVAEEALARLSERAAVSGTAWALGSVARARALLATGEEAEACFQESVAQLSRTELVTELARTRLTYGEWLRRGHRPLDARAQLRTAYDSFAAMGAGAFAQRARAELVATGGRAPLPAGPTTHGLTAQEGQVAALAAAGATNAEIATRLFITVSTVEYHMNKVLRKLAVTSRRQLSGALAGRPLPPPGAPRPAAPPRRLDPSPRTGGPA